MCPQPGGLGSLTTRTASAVRPSGSGHPGLEPGQDRSSGPHLLRRFRCFDRGESRAPAPDPVGSLAWPACAATKGQLSAELGSELPASL